MPNISEDVKQKIRFEAKRRFNHSDSDNDSNDKMLAAMFPDAAEYGYSLSIEEIEKLKLIAHEYAEAGRKEMERVDGLLSEIAELKAWKESAMSVMPPMQEIGKALGVKLGESIYDKILPGIQRLKGLIEKLVKDDNMFHIHVQDSYKEQKWQEFQKINQL